MDSRISDVLYIINRVKVLDGHFQVNQHQCKRLAGCYNRAGQFFNQLKENLNESVDPQRRYSLPSLDVTRSVLQKGQLLVEKYTEENWFDSMMTAGVNQDSFVAIHVELEACIRSIYTEVVKEGLDSRMQVPLMQLGTVVPLLFLDEDDRAMLFKGDAEKDKTYMLEQIESMKTATSNARNTNQDEIRSLYIASEKISATVDQQELPSYLRIESSEIEVLKQIGSGGSAKVYKCRWLHREYAVKIFMSGDVVGLRKEVENLIPLRHPNIVLMVGFSIRESDMCPMVVMELLDCDLRSLIQSDDGKVATRRRWSRTTSRTISKSQVDPFPLDVAIDFIYQIATGMAYIHKKMMFHGDLKALNVLVKRHQSGLNKWRCELKISDFGVSHKLVRKESHTGSDSDCTSFTAANIGTTRWRAPEVFDVTEGDLRPYSMKADVYSFAMTCVEILTRQVPFHYLSTREVREHVKAGRRPTLNYSLVPENLRKLIVRCWDQDPACRPDFSKICTYLQGLKEHVTSATMDVLDLEPNTEEMGDSPVVQSRVLCHCSIM
jgi:serine/threonine protein kinase